ncbi:hypothetical protein EXIGLDRAFT_420825 [Exidia glandulosa HHB12029]|uniref:Uncharacterized protein n=1 Tax=Exidia glandulosa HHB12029 TaxID=1314781 RepID=A0A165KLQ5_EXIGL|nr:hypothetical protein EXIGLDRAFT_420825 [Exidia glandulosa HHB12029]
MPHSAQSSLDTTRSYAYEDMSSPRFDDPGTASSFGLTFMRDALDKLEHTMPPQDPPVTAHSLAYLQRGRGYDAESLGREEDLELESDDPSTEILDQFDWAEPPVSDESFTTYVDSDSGVGCSLEDILDEVHQSLLEPVRKDSGQWVPCGVHEGHFRALPQLVPHDRSPQPVLHDRSLPQPPAPGPSQLQFVHPFANAGNSMPAARDRDSRFDDLVKALGTGDSAVFPRLGSHHTRPVHDNNPHHHPHAHLRDSTNNDAYRRSRTVSERPQAQEKKYSYILQREVRYKEPRLSPPPPPVPPKDDIPPHLLTRARAKNAHLSPNVDPALVGPRLRTATSSPSLLKMGAEPADRATFPPFRKPRSNKLQKPRPIQVFAPFASHAGPMASLSTGNLLSTLSEVFTTPISLPRHGSQRRGQ